MKRHGFLVAACALLLACACASQATAPRGGASGAAAAKKTGSGGGAETVAGATPSASAFKLDGVATWRGNATAAYSIVHDDLCADRVRGIFTHADPELTKRGLRAGFGAIAGDCEMNHMWAEVQRLIARGHDVFNHSWSHPCMTANGTLAAACDPAYPRSTNYAQEIDRAAATLKANGIVPDFFVFPFDVCDPAAVSRLKELGYLGARCGPRGINLASFVDSFKIRFDAWGPAYSMYITAPVCRGIKANETTPAQAPAACRTYVLNQFIDDAIEQKGWAMREFHGFEGDPGAWEAIPVTDYIAHLDYVAAKVKAGKLWVDGPTPVLKYRFARQYCDVPTVNKNTLKFAAIPTHDCARNATVLSYLVSTIDGSDPASLKVEQAGVILPARKLENGSFVVDADPTKGDAILSE